MNCYVKEKVCIEVEEQLLCFYRNENNINLMRYDNYIETDDKIIIEDCKNINNVFKGADRSISIIYTNLKGELKLSVYLDDGIVNVITLIKSVVDYSNMEIVSVNNSLNIFYINEINKINTLCYRILSNKLTLTPPIIIDGIDIKNEIPYSISANNGQLGVCYTKLGFPREIGYRKFDFLRNSWSNFKYLDTVSYDIEDINFLIKNDIIAYAYTYIRHKKGAITCGIGKEDNIKKNKLEDLESNITSSIINITDDNKLNLIYLSGTSVKVKELIENRDIRSIDEIYIEGIKEVNKYPLESYKGYSNRILVIKNETENIYIDSTFIESRRTKKYKDVVTLQKGITKDIVVTDEEVINIIENLDIEDEFDRRELIKKLIGKIKGYEETINKISESLIKDGQEKKKLLEDMDYLNEQLNKKDYKISSFEKILLERQNLIVNYDKKVQELTNMLRLKENKNNNMELMRLRELLDVSGREKDNYIKELNNYKGKIEELNSYINNKENEINSINIEKDNNIKELKLYKNRIDELSNLALSKENEIINLKNENLNYSNEIIVLKNRVNELSYIINKNTEENTNLKNTIMDLEEKNNKSFIKKLFKNGE